ncbi:MAG TPA: ChbG/HpnK family deacetylase [Myxococcales bacterium]|nr:ChbG/HpnK family deacetylase [Myxococcales bacterium]
MRPTPKRLVINADDLGYDPEIDRGIFEAHARGVVTSATGMVDTPFAPAALRAAPASLALGLHAVIDPSLPRAQAEKELLRQIARFAALRGAPPTHLDSHKHHHARPELLAAFAAVAGAQGLPVRALDTPMRDLLRAHGVRTTEHFLGDADLRPCWTPERLAPALETLEDGITELMCHPGYAPSHARTSFGAEREVELRSLCDARVRQALARAGAVLVSFRDL